MQSTQLNKKAFALSIVLWIVAALLFGIATLAVLSKDTVRLSKGIEAKLKTKLLADEMLEIVKFYILSADYSNMSFINTNLQTYNMPTKLVVDNRWYKIDDKTQIRLQDTSGMKNIFLTAPKVIAILATSSQQRQLRYVLTDSLQDWIDKDNIVSLNGAERSTYELKKNLNFKIRNANAMQHVEELRLVNGYDALSKEEWNSIKEKLFFANGNAVNLLLIDKKYLMYLLQIREPEAQALIEVRNIDKIAFINKVSKLQTFNEDYMGFYLAKQLIIEIKVSADGATSVIKTIIDFNKIGKKLYTVIDYKAL